MFEPYDYERDNENEPRCCSTCDGKGGWDVANDPEIYDQWEDCPDCLGSGEAAYNE